MFCFLSCNCGWTFVWLGKKSLLWHCSRPCFLCQKHNKSLFARSLLQRKQNQQTPDFAIPMWRPLWLSQVAASLTVSHNDIDVSSNGESVDHCPSSRHCRDAKPILPFSQSSSAWREYQSKVNVFNAMCAVRSSAYQSSAEDLFVQWSCKIGFWCWQLVALTDSRFMADGSRPDFYCLSPCYLALPDHLKKTPKIGEGRKHTHGSRWDIDHDDGSPREGGSSWSQWGSRLRAPKPKHPTGRTRPSDVHICNPKDGYCGKNQGGGRLIILFETLPILQLGLSTVRRVVRANKDNPTLQHSSQRGRERNDRNFCKSAWTLISFLLLFPFFSILSAKWNG